MTTKLTVRNCKNCQKPFTPTKVDEKHKGIFCSRSCASANRKKGVIAICPTCKNPFDTTKDKKRFCSVACFRESFNGDGNPSWKKGKQNCECVVCKKTFVKFASVNKSTCSNECHAILRSSLSAGNNNGNWKGGVKLKCVVCNKEFWKTPKRNTIFCSNACFHKVRFGGGFSNYKPSSSTGKKFGYGYAKQGTRSDIGIFVRSSWEANYARYLNFLISINEIVSWQYEKETFEFAGIKKGTRFYTPDFKVELSNDSIEYHEVKGYMYPKGKTALDRMAKFFPLIKIVLIQKNEYQSIARNLKNIIPFWE
jgi:hypothetical protein